MDVASHKSDGRESRCLETLFEKAYFNDPEKPGTCAIPNHVNVPPQHVAKIQVVAEIVKNFKIVIMRLSARLSLGKCSEVQLDEMW